MPQRTPPTAVHLVFPGVTEARLFPYLSLPMLVAYLRRHGVTAAQSDLNIALTHRLLEPVALKERLRLGGLDEFDETLLSFAEQRHDLLHRTVVRKETTTLPWDVGFRLVNNVLDIMLRGSALTRTVTSLPEVFPRAEREPAADDLAARRYDDLTLAALADRPARVLGLSVAYFSQLAPAFRVARLVKQRDPGTVVVLGGQQLMMRGAELAARPETFRHVDALVTTQGEAVLRRLAEAVEAGRPLDAVPGLVTAQGGGTPAPEHHLADNPPPDFDGLPFSSYLSPEPQLPLISCVGCYWGRCTFCSYGNRSRGRYQQLTQEQLADHVEHALRRTGARFVAFVDENCNLRLVLGAAELVRARGHTFTWSTRNRLEPLLADRAFVQRMHDAGCRLMSVGYETNSQRLLDLVDKGVRADLYERIVELLDEVGIVLRLSVMGGLPGETAEEARASREFLVRNSARLGIDAAQMMIAEPTSLLASEPRHRVGLTLADGDTLQSNSGFSYLAGRHGRAIAYEGTSREERADWLRETVRVVLPGKNDEKHPRWKKAGGARPMDELVLHPWIVPLEGRLIDLRWRMRYGIGPGHVTLRSSGAVHRLTARTDQGRRLLGLLKEADVGDHN
ncbi:B12-binding domain-containing radical SAM protein [Streptomyces nigra]|uniref:B12-binding domain-containing radical SAM protein n=1 Tax=Streptomyces nigra TaxID=1827580 RepID=UPI0037CF9E97